MKSKYLIIATIITLVGCVGFATQSGAVSDRASEARAAAELKREENKQRIAAKLSENKKRVCEKRQANILRTMQKMQTRGAKQLEVFTKIADRTKAFYEQKQRTVANYDDLVAAVDEKNQAAALAVAASSEAIGEFTCEADDPVALKDLFKAQLKDQIAALKAYKTAVKDLIVGVKSAQGQASRSTGDTTEQETTETTEPETQEGARQ